MIHSIKKFAASPSGIFIKKFIIIFACFYFALIALIDYTHVILRATHTEIIFDDAYMFVRYANNFWAGHGIAWNADGLQTYGTTSLLYLVVITALRGTWNSLNDSALLLAGSAIPGSLALIALIFSAQFATSSFFREKGLGYIYLIGTVFPIMIWFTSFSFHSVNGMDTNMSLLCNVFLIIVTLKWLHHRSKLGMLFTIAIAYLAYLARPDNLIYAGLFPLACILYLSPRRKADAMHFVLGLSSVLLLDSAVKFFIFGTPFPLSFYAKSNGYYEGYLEASTWNPLSYLFEFLNDALPFIVVTIIFVSKKSLQFCVMFLFPVLLTFLYYFSVVQIMGFGARFYFPALPFFVVSSFFVLDHYWQDHGGISTYWKGKLGLVRLLLIIAISYMSFNGTFQENAAEAYSKSYLSSQQRYAPSVQYEIATQSSLPALGWWRTIQEVSEIVTDLPEGTKVALSEHGLIGARAPQVYIIDPQGLHDSVFALHGFSADEFLTRDPDFIWFPHPAYTKIVSSILSSIGFWEKYDFYPDVFDYGIAIKKNSANTELIYHLVNDVFHKNYGDSVLDDYLATPLS